MFASARVVHHKTAGLRFWRNNQWRILQPAILIANRKKPRRSGQGVWRGVNEIFGMRDGWHTIPVKLLSQLWLSFGPPCSSNSSMGLSRYKRNRFRLHVLDSVYCSYWAIQSCRPTHNMNKESRDTSSVLSEWHDRGERRPISSGDSTAYEYVL